MKRRIFIRSIWVVMFILTVVLVIGGIGFFLGEYYASLQL